ncbi:WD40 repeat-like protein [Metschnikowia bicuspidata]|uniref:WD40 repeat-like protein n=1 Tax=Metschnikowia bicuspidata TaxID=27322 RepID=A0A4P9ZCE2_9ASCO|nr:WD40 repeat-like protein [Metschnikowia bicuspidata]
MSFTSSATLLGSQTSAATGQELVNDITLNNDLEDTVSDLCFSPQQDLLAVASWDKKVRIYDIDPNTGNNQGRALFEHDGPVFSARWLSDGARVCSGGADKQVKLFDLASQQTQQIGVHDAPVRAIRSVQCGPTNTEVVVSGSWDKTLKYWDMRSPQPISVIQLPEKVYCMDSAQKLLVVACAERHIAVVDLSNPQQIYKSAMSPLKYQTRAVACYPTGEGYAIGSIEARCAIQYVDDAEQQKKGFSFRCHRKTSNGLNASRTSTIANTENLIYPLNSISFHPIHGTFSTAGSDGTFCFWDKDARQRLKNFPNVGSAITATAFNRNGTIFAYARGYDWAVGYQGNRPDIPTDVKLHALKDEEIKQKKPLTKR